VVPGVLEPALVESLRREMNEILDKARGLTAHTDVYDLEPGHRPDAPRVRRIKTPHRFLPGFEKLYRNPRLVGIVQKLVGSSVRLHGSKLNMKASRYGSPVEWHQDWAFYPHTNDDLLAVGVMLDDCTLENGPLLVVPKSHTGPIWDHHADGRFCGAVDPATIKAEIDRAVPLTGSAGSMGFHHVRLLHGSAQNVSDRRPIVDLREQVSRQLPQLHPFEAQLPARVPPGDARPEHRGQQGRLLGLRPAPERLMEVGQPQPVRLLVPPVERATEVVEAAPRAD
jgi:hypothetical protein